MNNFLLLYYLRSAYGIWGICLVLAPEDSNEREKTNDMSHLLQSLTWHFENNNSNTTQMDPRWWRLKEGEKWINRHTVREQNTRSHSVWRRTGSCSNKGFGHKWCSFAHINPLRDPALVTEHVAAPMEAAVASFTAGLFEDVVSTAAAQRPAAVHAGAALVTDSTLRAQRIHRRLTIAEVGRLLEVDQLARDASPPAPDLLRADGLCNTRVEYTVVLVLRVYEDGSLEFFSQKRSHEPEFGRHVPAGLELAAAGCAMTLALSSHVVCNYLLRSKP